MGAVQGVWFRVKVVRLCGSGCRIRAKISTAKSTSLDFKVVERTCTPVPSDAGSFSRLIDVCITQVQTLGPSGTCFDNNQEAEDGNVGEGNGPARRR